MKSSTITMLADKLRSGKCIDVSSNYTFHAPDNKLSKVHIDICDRLTGKLLAIETGNTYDSAVIMAIYWIRKTTNAIAASSYYRRMRVINAIVRKHEYDYGSAL